MVPTFSLSKLNPPSIPSLESDHSPVSPSEQDQPPIARKPPNLVIQRAFEAVSDGPITVWANFNLRETMPDPLAPLTWTVLRDTILPLAMALGFGVSEKQAVFSHLMCIDRVNGRVYWNINGMRSVPILGSVLWRALETIDARTAGVLRDLSDAGVVRPRRLPGKRWALGFSMARSMIVTGLRSTLALRPKWSMRQLDECAARIASRREVSKLKDQDLFDEMFLPISPAALPFRNGMSAIVLALLSYFSAQRAFRHHPQAQQLLAAGASGPTTRISLAIDALIQHAKPLEAYFQKPLETTALLEQLENVAGGAAWVARFNSFLSRFGHRCPREFDLSAPRWRDAPEMILDLVRAGLLAQDHTPLSVRLDQLEARRRKTISMALFSAPFWKRPVMRLLAGAVPRLMPLREAPKHYALFILERMRDAAQEMGKRLVVRGYLERPEDVYYLELPELREVLVESSRPGSAGPIKERYRQLVAERRKDFARFLEARPAEILRSDGVPVFPPAVETQTETSSLHGTGISAGRASGPIRVLHTPDPKAMADGDVIVMEVADPGWTPLFPRAAAVVMEVGGLMCHAAVVARELGVPAVFGVPRATEQLKDGQHVTVDGTTGEILLTGPDFSAVPDSSSNKTTKSIPSVR